jgi:5-methylcytosine-specific restriction endonuclease McrA
VKSCSKCKTIKPLDSYSKWSRGFDGYKPACKECCSLSYKKWRENNVDKERERSKKYLEENKDKERERKLQYYYDNSEDMQAGHKDWAALNPNYSSDYMKQWREDNPGRSSEYVHVRRTRMQNNGLYKVLKRDLKKLYSSACLYCGSTDRITADHIVPISRGGSHGIGNLAPACWSCNSSKGAKLLVEWRNV